MWLSYICNIYTLTIWYDGFRNADREQSELSMLYASITPVTKAKNVNMVDNDLYVPGSF